MKYKIVTVAALLAVIIAMTGVATAYPGLGVSPDDVLTVDAGQTITHTVNIVSLTSLEITGYDFDLASKFYVTIDGVPTTSVSFGTPTTKTLIVNYTNNKSAPNGYYVLTYTGKYYDSTYKKWKAIEIPSIIQAIPEFPTVALPVAAVIGLVFFFHSRKRKGE